MFLSLRNRFGALRELDLSGCGLAPYLAGRPALDGVHALARALPRARCLTRLDLSGNALGARGAAALAPALGAPLRCLELGDNQICRGVFHGGAGGGDAGGGYAYIHTRARP